MTLTLQTQNAADTSVAASPTSFTATVPASAAGDQLFVAVVSKSETGSASTSTTGWTVAGVANGGGGTTGADAGPSKVTVFTAPGGSAAPVISCTGINVLWYKAWVMRATSGQYDIATAGGADSTTGTAWSVTCTTNPDLQAGDLIMVVSGDPTDVSHTYASPAVSATGVTAWGAATIHDQPRSGTGNDIGGFVFSTTVTTGTSTAAPVVTATVSGTTTNVRGPSLLVRTREIGGGGATHQVTASGTGQTAGSAAITVPPKTLALTAAGAGQSAGTAAASLAAAVTASGTGTSGGSATLTRHTTLTASGTGQTGGSAAATVVTNTVTHQVTASGDGTTAGSAAVQVDPRIYPLAAIGTGSTGGSVAITRHTTLTGDATSVVDGAAALSVTHALTGSGSGATDGTAALSATHTASADGSTASDGTAALTLRVVIAADGSSTSTGDAYIGIVGAPQDYPLSADGTSHTGGGADYTIPAKTVEVTAAGLSQMAGAAAPDVLIGGSIPVYDVEVAEKAPAVDVVQKSPPVEVAAPMTRPTIGVSLRPYSISVEERP